MLFGSILIIVCVIGGFAAMGGNPMVLWQPFEIVIVVGAAFGALVIGNPLSILKQLKGAMRTLFQGSRHDKSSYLELMSLLYTLFKTSRSKGLLTLEAHIDHPEESELFARFPQFYQDKQAMTFLCDYLRLLTLGAAKPEEMKRLMAEDLDTHAAEQDRIVGALQSVAEATPALGIVAAVLGVIKAMASIDAAPEVLGNLVGGALVGTFIGIFLAYGFLGPMAAYLRIIYEEDLKYLQSIQAGLLAHLNGYSPAIAIEFSRKVLMSDVRPTFQEVEDATTHLQMV